jgi:hypothetical protein
MTSSTATSPARKTRSVHANRCGGDAGVMGAGRCAVSTNFMTALCPDGLR